jgi:aminopeptidase N
LALAAAGQPDSLLNTTVSHWLSPGQHLVVPVTDQNTAEQPLLINLLQTGYYRVNYDERNWELLAAFLTGGYHMDIHRTIRAQANFNSKLVWLVNFFTKEYGRSRNTVTCL